MDWRVLRPLGPQPHEKNWIPQASGNDLRFLCSYDPTRVVDEQARMLSETIPVIAADQFRGGTQAIEFSGGWLTLTLEVTMHQDKRHHQHRFVWFDAIGVLRKVSLRFYFHNNGIEFAAGMAWHPDGEHLLISYGVEDSESRIAIVDAGEVWAALTDAVRLSRDIRN
jgi:hypothetical protein